MLRMDKAACKVPELRMREGVPRPAVIWFTHDEACKKAKMMGLVL